jgi:hypothetical protein
MPKSIKGVGQLGADEEYSPNLECDESAEYVIRLYKKRKNTNVPASSTNERS